ncbi:MAG: DoxX family protein [Bryobacteraceae bacterium]
MRIGAGLLFFQHGAEKLWGFAHGRVVGFHFTSLLGIAGPLEVIGGFLIIVGLFTRTAAFILSGEMAVAYFSRWAPRGFWPISNGGEEAAIFCFIFFWLVAAGPGPWSVDELLRKSRSAPGAHTPQKAVSSLESYLRSLLRFVLAFTFSLHGYRLAFGVLPALAGRQSAVPMALDRLPPVFGVLEIAGGLLLFIGLLTRPVALILSCQLLLAYFYVAVPKSIWPIRNGGNEVLLYLLVFVYLALSGAGKWSWDDLRKKRASGDLVSANAPGIP